MNNLVDFLEIIGTIAFSISGSLTAIGANLDIFGVVFVGYITSVGGGIIRDISLGVVPPAIFSDYIICAVALLTSVMVFAIAYIKSDRFNTLRLKVEYINNFFDAVGLGVFSVIGAQTCIANVFSDNPLLVIVSGMITGIGGGIMRDVLINTTPYVFKKHIYALASISGTVLYFVLINNFGNNFFVSVLAISLVVIIRLLATRYCWSLPKVTLK